MLKNPFNTNSVVKKYQNLVNQINEKLGKIIVISDGNVKRSEYL